MKIWLDDLRKPPEGYTWVKNQAELIALLESNQEVIKVMSFDHDLGDTEPDGYMIIKHLATHYLERWPQEIHVHSANPPGAANIKAFAEFVKNRILT